MFSKSFRLFHLMSSVFRLSLSLELEGMFAWVVRLSWKRGINIGFRALPTQFVRKPHATTPFSITGLAGQSWPNKLSISHPTPLTLPSFVQ